MADDVAQDAVGNPLESSSFPEVALVLRSEVDGVLQRWDEMARQVQQVVANLNLEQMRNGMPEILRALADLLDSPTREHMQALVDIAPSHGIARFHQRYDLAQLMTEGRLLRRVITAQVEEALKRQMSQAESVALHTGIDLLLHGGIVAMANQQNAQLRQAQQEAEVATQAKDEFLAVLSHELRTPLTPVLLAVSLLERRPDLPAETRDDIETIRRGAELQARLIDDLLDLTRITRGKLQVEAVEVDVHMVMRRAFDLCCSGQPHQIALELQAEEHHVYADPTRLQQVFWNLLNNAVKFTPPNGSIHVRSSNVNGQVRVEITDTGVGIGAELLPRLFNAFEQGGAATTRRFGGLGLGLAISKRLLDLQGGSLTAHSEGKGKGATFTVGMPVLARRAVAAQPVQRPEPAQRSLNILLVEDNEATVRTLARLLESMGHRVTTALTAESALKTADQERFDLLISDLGLPDKSGHELMRTLRERWGIVGIALSGYGMQEDIRRSREAGFAAHLTKPTSLPQLKDAMAAVTGQAGYPPPPNRKNAILSRRCHGYGKQNAMTNPPEEAFLAPSQGIQQ